MLEEIIKIQEKAVRNLLIAIYAKEEITFKAPTGSGKTIMMSEFMNKVIEGDNSVCFIVSSLSKGELAKQNYETFEKRALNENRLLNPYLINSDVGSQAGLFIPTDYNVYVLPRDLFRDKTRLAQGALQAFIDEKIKTNKIYLIKDECHQATSNLDELSDNFTKIINVSATPNLKRKQNPDVVVDEDEAVAAHLIKHVDYGDDSDDLEKALDKFVKIKDEYNNELSINPCFIIQVSTKEKAEEEIEDIKNLLNLKFNELKWMLIVDKESACQTNDKLINLKVSKWKDYAKQPNATIDIIIFKMVITEGWDIPRACMLYQIRDSKSKQLDEQVIGRVRRNPRLLDFETLNERQRQLATTAYVWGMVEHKVSKIVNVKLISNSSPSVKKEIQVCTTRLKTDLIAKNFRINGYINKNNLNQSSVNKSIFELYKEYMRSSDTLKSMIASQITCYKDWQNFTKIIDKLELELKNLACDYDNNLEVLKDDLGTPITTSFPNDTSYLDTSYSLNICDWIWQHSNIGDSEYSFDSMAEKEWVCILLKLTTLKKNGKNLVKKVTTNKGGIEEDHFLLAKNFLENSEIKYEYYNFGKRFSYPDFLLVDYKGNYHLFESKSVNESNSFNIDNDSYNEKTNALKACYKASSKLLPYFFYIPIKIGDDWQIYMYSNGKEYVFNLNEFKEYFYKI